MATINLGRVKPVFRGAYSGATAYVVDDIVTYSNETYICILASTGNLPTDTTYFTKLAAKGVDGTDVGTTLTTQGDILYRDGSGLQRLGAGTSGQFLKTLGTGANPSWGDVSSAIRKVTMFNDATYNISLSNASVSFPITFDFVKAQADSDIFIQGWTPVSSQASYRAGERMRIQRISDSAFDTPTDGEGYGGHNFQSPPASAGADQPKGVINWSRRIDTSTETLFNSAETYRIFLGWSTGNGGAEQPGVIWNPQNTAARDRQSTTNIWVWELDPSATSFIT